MATKQQIEIVQDVIDRLLYLPEAQRMEYENYLNRLTAVYTIPMEVKDGVRVYQLNKNLQ